MEKLDPGTTVYFCWYDFQHKKEHTLMGEVVDDSDYQSTQWADFIYVRFQPPGVSAPIHHHFLPERLSTDQSNVPHDDCYLICGEHAPVKPQQTKGNPWLQMTEFKNQHWDNERNCLQVDALDDFYRLWSIAINWRVGKEITKPYPTITRPSQEITQGYQETSAPSPVDSVAEAQQPKKTAKKPKSNNIIELSLFE